LTKYVLITAGNSSEPIDSVRSITNTASGKLGSLIADVFTEKGAGVIYVCGKNAIKPTLPTHQTITVEGVSELYCTITELSKKYRFDCIIHSMAVSDYTVKGVLSYEELSEAILQGANPRISTTPGKLSSDLSDPVILLEKAPKVIGEFKRLQPQALLVGFKLLVGVTEQELYAAAIKLMQKNNCDFICANDLNHINQDKHEAILISADGQSIRLSTKEEIAHTIGNKVLSIWGGQE
jgi:phosphopantothenate--cysteine ligase